MLPTKMKQNPFIKVISVSKYNSNIPTKDKNGSLLLTGEEQNAIWAI